MRLLLASFFLILSINIATAQTTDYLIVENPSSLTVYNKYQQHLSDEIYTELIPFAPFQIISESELLSDQITQGSRVMLDNQILFLVKDDHDRYSPDKNEYIRLFKKCDIYGDTIKVLKNLRVSIFEKPEHRYKKNKHIYLDPAQECIRVFKYRNLHYLKLLADSVVYGWTNLPRNGWEIYHQSDKKNVKLSENLISRLKIRIESANQDYENFFNYFNKKHNLEKSIPYWNLEIDEYEITGMLNNLSLGHDLKNSNRYLMRDIENIFLGSNFKATTSDSIFTIRQKQ